MMENGGLDAQLTGERAQTKVRDALLDAGLFCSKFEIDRGEDLLIELDAYAPNDHVRAEPRIGLLQIKGHDADEEPIPNDGYAKRRLNVVKLRRWAAYPLPVFVAAVNIHGSEPRFFARSIDKIVGDVAPHGLDSLDQESLTIQIPFAADLAELLTNETASFYSV